MSIQVQIVLSGLRPAPKWATSIYQKGINSVGDRVSSGEGCVYPGQQPNAHPCGNIAALWRAGGRSGFPLQILTDVHIYISKHRTNNTGGPIDGLEDTQRALH